MDKPKIITKIFKAKFSSHADRILIFLQISGDKIVEDQICISYTNLVGFTEMPIPAGENLRSLNTRGGLGTSLARQVVESMRKMIKITKLRAVRSTNSME